MFSNILIEKQIERSLLRQLHDRQLGPGETVWLSTLANDLQLSVPQLLTSLDKLKLGSYVAGRKGKQPSVSVPSSDLLCRLLNERGIDAKLLEPMQGIINGSWHAIKWLERPSVCENGNVRFRATWKGKLPPSFVCCHDLNVSARAHVCDTCAVRVFTIRCCWQAERQFDLVLLAEDQPRPVHVSKIVSNPAVSAEDSKYRIRFSNGTESDPLTFQELNGVARLLLDQEPSIPLAPQLARRGRRLGGKKRGRLDVRRMRQKKQNNRQARATTNKEAPIAGKLRSFGKAATASKLCRSVDENWDRKLTEDKQNIDKFPCAPTDGRIRQSIHKWRQLVSSPHIDTASCAVCAERKGKSLVRTFAVSDPNSGNFQKIGPAVLDFMKHQMVHDPLLPSHLSELPEGKCQ